MGSWFVPFHARDGRKMFAFDTRTDPIEVLEEFCWAWAEPDRQSVCGGKVCPTNEGTYCTDCHSVAYSAVETARKRMGSDDG